MKQPEGYLSAVYIHLVFSTKDRRSLLRDKPIPQARDSICISAAFPNPASAGPRPSLSAAWKITYPAIAGLARFGRTLTQAEWVKELKRVSNLWRQLA